MKAMILSAGLGTRLRPLTNDRPKALVTVAGRTLLDLTLSRLRSFGVNEVIVNTHHYAEMVIDYLKANNNFGMRIEVSREELLLDTGGGLKHAAHFFLDSSEPFILHNVDILSTIDFEHMIRFHTEQKALVTLAMQERETSRYLLFDEHNQLCGRRTSVDAHGDVKEELARPAQQTQALAFSGIHIISPRLFEKMHEDGVFSILSTYMRLAAQGEKIIAFRADGFYWRDLGRPESVAQATLDIERGKYRASEWTNAPDE